MCNRLKCITHYSNFHLIWEQIMLQNCVGCDFPRHSAVLTPNNKSNLHFPASLFVMGSIAKIRQEATDVWGDRSQRRGAVANFMACIFLSCMANSRFRPARWNASPCDLPQSPLAWASSGGSWAIFMRGGLANPYYGLLSYIANSEIAR